MLTRKLSKSDLLTIGYGDICPMGWSKYVALFNGFVVNFIAVVIMVMVVSAFLKRSES